MLNREEKIQNRVQEHYDYIKDEYEVVGVFLQGSQNYGLDVYDENYMSDVDTKAILLPSFEDIVYNREPISTTLILPNNEHIDLKDIRIMLDTFLKQNVNFIEILFTKFKVLNPKYKDLIQPLFDNKESIARYDFNKALNCQMGMSEQKYVALEHPYPTIKDKIDKYGYDCYSEDTYFLTDSGYKLFDEITDNDKLATMNTLNGALEFQCYTDRIDKVIDDCLYDIENRESHFKITGNHNLYCSKVKCPSKNTSYEEKFSKWDFVKLKYCINNQRYNHIISFPINSNNEFPISDDMLKLLGAYISEGTINFRDNKIKNLIINQTNHGKTEFINMIDNLHIKFNKYVIERNDKGLIEYEWHFSKDLAKTFLDWCGHGSKLKRLPSFIYKLSKRQCRILLKSLLLGDGSFYNSRDVYYTSNENLAKDVLSLSLLSGYHSKLDGSYTSNNKYNKDCAMYHIEIKHKELKPSFIKLGEFNKDRNSHIKSIVNTKQRVVCFEVPNSTLVTMNNGKSAVQGNCKQLHHIVRMNDFIKKYIAGKSYEECLIPDNKEWLIELKKNTLSLEEARALAKQLNQETYKLGKEAINDSNKRNEEIVSLLNKVKYDLLKYRFKEELLKEENKLCQ